MKSLIAFHFIFIRTVINAVYRYGNMATVFNHFANSLFFLLQLTPPGKSPIVVQVANPGSLTVTINDVNEKVINFTLFVTTKVFKMTLLLSNFIFILPYICRLYTFNLVFIVIVEVEIKFVFLSI